jgi:hypothetical protein
MLSSTKGGLIVGGRNGHKQLTNILLHALDGRSAAHNETDHKKNQKDNEQNPCNVGRGTGDTAES